MPAGYRLAIHDLPSGTSYAVTEDAKDGWELATRSGTTGEVAPLVTSVATFRNRYAPGTCAAQVVGTKTLDGALAASGAFSFELVEDGIVIETVQNGAGGLVEFTPTSYDAVGLHTYVVREVRGLLDTLTYDTAEFSVTVQVADDGAGNLTASVTYPDGRPAWANRTNPGTLRISKLVEGASTANADDEFTFTVRLTDPTGQLVNGADVRMVE